MTRFLKLTTISIAILLAGCQGNPGNNDSASNAATTTKAHQEETTEYLLTELHSENETTLLRVAILGDAEPKPLAEFPNMADAVTQINTLAQTKQIDFVIGVGDIAHKGTIVQYEAATEVLQKLSLPFYPIMGNEEHGSTVERYLHYAQQWNSNIIRPDYVLNHEKVAFVFASPDHGRDFDDSGASWILDQLQRLAPKPVFLVIHAAQQGVFPENPDKGISNELFKNKVISQPNLAAVIAGDLHMDMDRVHHSKKINQVHYLHIPALERTKIPDETNHTTMFRVMTISKDGQVSVDTYAIGDSEPREEHAYSFMISFLEK
jgi:3',5'-cyclic-AMP phosphodiesterase